MIGRIPVRVTINPSSSRVARNPRFMVDPVGAVTLFRISRRQFSVRTGQIHIGKNDRLSIEAFEFFVLLDFFYLLRGKKTKDIIEFRTNPETLVLHLT